MGFRQGNGVGLDPGVSIRVSLPGVRRPDDGAPLRGDGDRSGGTPGLSVGHLLDYPDVDLLCPAGAAIFILDKNLVALSFEGARSGQVVPQFPLTPIFAELAGIGIAGLLASAILTLDSSINSSAANGWQTPSVGTRVSERTGVR